MDGEGVRMLDMLPEGKDCEGVIPVMNGEAAGNALDEEEKGEEEEENPLEEEKPLDGGKAEVEEGGNAELLDEGGKGEVEAGGKGEVEEGGKGEVEAGEEPQASSPDMLPGLEDTLPKREELPPGEVTSGTPREDMSELIGC